MAAAGAVAADEHLGIAEQPGVDGHEQDAERARFLVEKAEQEKKAAIIRAEGEATAAAVVSEALQGSPALVELRRIEAAKEIAETLSKSRNVTYLPSGGQNMLLNINSAGSSA